MRQMEKQAVDWVREGWLGRGPSLLGGGDFRGEGGLVTLPLMGDK